jgi:two-component system, probable response regulator PhcQ
MNHLYDYKAFSILYVDDETMSLKYFKAGFEEHFSILTASNAQEALEIFEKNVDQIGIVITDQRMPAQTGVELLEKVRQKRPKIIRMLATAYSDIDAAVAAVNTGAIYKYISKPWEQQDLEITLRRAMEFFIVQRERDALFREKLSAFHRVMMTDRLISLGLLASGISHHLRNALVAVRVFLDLAPMKLEEEKVNIDQLRNPDYWNDFYKTVQGQMIRATGLLDSLGEIPREPATLFNDQIKLSDVIQKFVTEKKLQPGWGSRSVEIQSPATEPTLHVDKKIFFRLFELLFEHLNKSTPKDANVRLVIESKPESNEVKLQIFPTGLRLPEGSLRHIFDPFYVQKEEGVDDAGLNLLSCFFIVYHHGGQFAASIADQAHYSITLPINPAAAGSRTDEEEFLNKVFATESAWEKLLIS